MNDSTGVRIGHASADENGRAAGGAPGDQTGREVCVRNWYNGGWNVVLRPKSAAVAEQMARFCEAVCENDNIGYDQYQRNTLRAEAKKAGWDAACIKTPCETDCSAFMTVCAEAAGVAVAYTKTAAGTENAPVTQNMRRRFFETGQFDALPERKYTDSGDYLLRGDILVRESGHTAMALSNGAKAAEERRSAPEGANENSAPFGGGEKFGEEENMVRYNELGDMPAWARDTVQKLCGAGIILGGGQTKDGDPADLNLSEDMLRQLVWNDRAGLYAHL